MGKEYRSLQELDYFSPKLKKYREQLIVSQKLVNENKKLKHSIVTVMGKLQQ